MAARDTISQAAVGDMLDAIENYFDAKQVLSRIESGFSDGSPRVAREVVLEARNRVEEAFANAVLAVQQREEATP